MLKTITLPDLNPGERYAGLILDETGTPTHHLVLLPGDEDSLTFDAANKWAASIGGALPTRNEQSLLYANCKAQFESDWYWSGEQRAAVSGDAWYQGFDLGYQFILIKGAELRARAVRRLPI